jgi:hypothetical protein
MLPVLAAPPEKPPPANGFMFNAGPKPGAVAAVDVDGDKRLDVVLLDQQEASVRIYGNMGGPGMLAAPAVVKLPSVGKKIAVTGCANQPFAVLLADGTMVSVSKGGMTQPTAGQLTAIKAMASTSESVAMAYGPQTQLAIYNACETTGAFPDLPAMSVLALAVAPSNQPNHQELALLGTDGKTVSVYELVGY